MTAQHDPAFGVWSHVKVVVVRRETRNVHMHALRQLSGMQGQFDALGILYMQADVSAQAHVVLGVAAQALLEKEGLREHRAERVFQRRRHGVAGRRPEAVRMVQVQEVVEKIDTRQALRASGRQIAGSAGTGDQHFTATPRRQFQLNGSAFGVFIEDVDKQAVEALVGNRYREGLQYPLEVVKAGLGKTLVVDQSPAGSGPQIAQA